jgi:ribosomal protein L40E
MHKALSKMSQEMEKAFSIAAKDVQEAFQKARNNAQKSINKEKAVCTNCDEKNPAGSVYCSKCGSKIPRKTA